MAEEVEPAIVKASGGSEALALEGFRTEAECLCSGKIYGTAEKIVGLNMLREARS